MRVFQTLRDKLRCKEIWMVGADKWRNPDEDLPVDFEQRRAENYAALRKPLDPKAFTAQMRTEMAEAPAGLNDHLPRDRRVTGQGVGRRPVSEDAAGQRRDCGDCREGRAAGKEGAAVRG